LHDHLGINVTLKQSDESVDGICLLELGICLDRDGTRRERLAGPIERSDIVCIDQSGKLIADVVVLELRACELPLDQRELDECTAGGDDGHRRIRRRRRWLHFDFCIARREERESDER
jgi:hypothetical protein